MEAKAQLWIGSFFLVIFLIWGGMRIYQGIIFDINCGDRLKRAADANTVQIAKEELKASIAYMEKSGLILGYTSILYKTPDEDIGFWYRNIKSSYEELKNLPESTTSLEKSNVLIKLRETLLDNNGVTFPRGISIYPDNVFYAWWAWISLIITLVFFIWWKEENI